MIDIPKYEKIAMKYNNKAVDQYDHVRPCLKNLVSSQF